MSNIAYDPVKDVFARITGRSFIIRRIFYFVLDMMFLRSWYVRKVIHKYCKGFDTSEGWSLLDAGCGFGQYDRYILSKFNKVKISSVDIKEDYLNDCRRYFREDITKQRITFSNEDLYNIDYEKKFDFVICIDVLEHIEDDQKVLNNISASLKDGGYLLMHSPSDSYTRKGDNDFFVDEHFRQGYSQQEIKDKLWTANMKPVEVEYTYGPAGHIAWIIGVKVPMILLSKLKIVGVLIMVLYLPIVLPLFLLLNCLEVSAKVKKGRGIYAVGRKC